MMQGFLNRLKKMLDFLRTCFYLTLVWLRKNPIKSFLFLFYAWKFYFLLPPELFDSPYSFVIESREGQLLGARIADDGQWRFPAQDSVPEKFKKCIVAYEDRYFYYHLGVNPVAIYGAFQTNRKAGKIVRGGSTLTQQVVRLARKNPERTYGEKLVEMVWALRLELAYSKEEILSLYATHAPFGGNVVGLEMAAYRYFGLNSHQLSWAQAATLAVLPNAPGLIFPGKNQDELRRKRDALMRYLHQSGEMDAMELQLSLQEPLPDKPHQLPEIAQHLLNRLFFRTKEHQVKTTIDFHLQERVHYIVDRFYRQYSQNEVHNMAVLVVDVETREVLVYIGNTPTDKAHSRDVDNIRAPRSTGSILKPFLFAEMIQEGELLSGALVPDIPTQISGFSPQNSSLSYDGAVPAWKALSRSLNIPSVLMLQQYGVNKFYRNLKNYGLSTLNQQPMHYGLSLILGGAETTLWDLCRAYAGYVSIHNNFHKNGTYQSNPFCDLKTDFDAEVDFGESSKTPPFLSAGAIHQTFEAMREVNRPEHNESWEYFSSAQPIAWKTGTSFGNRDAWAIGCSRKYVVGIWVGNSTGEGRPELTGVSYAGSVLFDVFSVLEAVPWFKRPEMDMQVAEVCDKSGFLAGPHCSITTSWVSKRGLESDVCPYHHLVQLDSSGNYRVHSNCERIDLIQSKVWFTLPPVMEWYYKRKYAEYVSVPPFREDCRQSTEQALAFIYPKSGALIYRAKSFDGELQPVVCKVAHRNPDAELFWYLNDKYLGSTQRFHEFPIKASIGKHVITVVDENGNDARCVINVE
jgi:penicillin-binding protein 1C